MTGHGRPEEPSTAQGIAAQAENIPAYLRPWVDRYGEDIGPVQYNMVRGRDLVLSDRALVDALATVRLRVLENGGPQGALFVERSRIDLAMRIEPEDHARDVTRSAFSIHAGNRGGHRR
jgi:sirohydrochlorin ferrochelatase